MTFNLLNRSSLMVSSIAAIAAVTSFAASAQAQIKIDGSSTVFPITERAASEFQKTGKKVTVGISGTGGGFKKFCKGETHIANASRLISDKEKGLCKDGNVKYVELKIARDAITVVVSPNNTFASNITKAQLKKIWDNGSTVKNWNEADSSFPNQPIKLFGPGSASGTFDYFTEAINGKAAQGRADYTASEDDNVLVQGVSRDKNAMGYFGFAYFEKNKSRLKALNIDGVAPTLANVTSNKYPLSRPLYIYVNVDKLNSDGDLKAFVNLYLNGAEGFVSKAGYLPLSSGEYNAAKKAIADAK